MGRLRYKGDQRDGRLVPLSGAWVHVPRMKWVDLVAEAEALGVRRAHAEVAARDLVTQDDWESEAPKKAARTRAQKAAAADDPAEEADE